MRRGCNGIGLLLFLGIFSIVGIGLSIWGGMILHNASVSSDWLSVQGEIISSNVRVDSDEDGTTYHAEVAYQYVVDDQWYTADIVSFGQYGSSDSDYAQEIVNRYTVGKLALVYYDAEEPETAVLEPGVTWSSYMVLAMGLCFTFVPLLILLGSVVRRIRI